MVMGEDLAGSGKREELCDTDGAIGADEGICPPETDDAPAGYEAPAIVYRAPLEATAAFCDPVEYGKTEGYCWLGPINS